MADACFQVRKERLRAFDVISQRTRDIRICFHDPRSGNKDYTLEIKKGDSWSGDSGVLQVLSKQFGPNITVLYSEDKQRVENELDFNIFCYWAERRSLESNAVVVATIIDKNPPKDLVVLFIDRISVNEQHSYVFNISWGITWSDVLDELKYQFGRAVIFEYRNENGQIEVVNSEVEFDQFCSWAETLQESPGTKITANIRNATFKPSSEEKWEELQYLRVLKTLPWQEDTNQPSEGVDDAKMTILSDSRHVQQLQNDSQSLSIEMAGKGLALRATQWSRLIRFLDHAPVPPEYMWFFGVSGFVATSAGGIIAYAYDYNSVGSVTLALPWNLFLISLFVGEVEEGYEAVLRFGVAFAGVLCATCAIPALSLAGEFAATIPLYVWFLASLWYVELMVRALGWSSWFQGLFSLAVWLSGGCSLAGVREREKVEEITIVGNRPPDTASTKGRSDREVYPGVSLWLDPDQPWEKMQDRERRVRHVAQCLFGDGNRPEGPLRKGVIPNRTARKLRKWLVRTEKHAKRKLKEKDVERELAAVRGWGFGTILSYSKELGVKARRAIRRPRSLIRGACIACAE